MLTRDNHIGSIFHTEPQRASNIMVELLAYHRGRSLESFLQKLPTKEFESDEEYTWDVVGSSRRNIPLVEARDENGNVVTENSGMVGAYTAPFELVFAEDWFADGRLLS